MPVPTADQAATKWEQRTRGAQADYVAGTQAVTESPMISAVAQRAKWVAKMTDPATHDKWERNTLKVTLVQWKDFCKTKGAAAFAAGVTAAVGKYRTAIAPVLAHISTGLTTIEALPNVTRADAKMRMDAWFDHMSGYTG